MILALKTDQPETELLLLQKEQVIDSLNWQAHRELSNTLLLKIEELLQRNKLTLSQLQGVMVYQGPGSFTGLRIGCSVANTIAYTQNIPIVAEQGKAWQKSAYKKLTQQTMYTQPIVPFYGSEARITQPKK